MRKKLKKGGRKRLYEGKADGKEGGKAGKQVAKT